MAITVLQGNLKEMAKGGPFYIRDMELAHHYCKGVGIELGAAAHNPFNLPNAINVAPFSDDPESVDYKDFLIYQQEQVRNCGHYAKVDLVGEADAVSVEDRSQDYVISSHVVEHLPDLLSAFMEWNRFLRPGGIIFMIFPKHDAAAMDALRPITPLSHFIEDWHLKRTIWTHSIEEGHGIRGHYHVFTLGSMLELIHWANLNLSLSWKIEAVEETDSKFGNGHTVICRYLPGETHTVDAARVYVQEPSNPEYIQMRMRQLLNTSSQMIAEEGFGAFSQRLLRWLRGERRYFRR